MILNVAELMQQEGQQKQLAFSVAPDLLTVADGAVNFPTPLQGTAVAWNTSDGLYVQFEVSGEVELTCDRCLTRYLQPLALKFSELFREGQHPEGSDSTEPIDDEGQLVTYFQGDQLDLTEAIRQHVLLGLPIKAVCQSDCQGLCPTCGTNLNETPCTCERESLDPRLSVLKQLLGPDQR